MTDFTEYLNYLLQQDATFYIKNKVYKKGKIILYTIDDFHIHFVTRAEDSSTKYFEIPMPFSIHHDKKDIVFDYTLKSLSNGNDELYYRLSAMNKLKKSKLYDAKIKIVIN